MAFFLYEWYNARNTVWGRIHFILGAIHIIIGMGVWAGLMNEIDDTAQEVYFWRPRFEHEDISGYTVTSEKVVLGSGVSPILIHVIVSILTGASHMLSFHFYKEYGLCQTRPNKIRWAEYAVTATLMTLSAYISLGEGNILFLVTTIIMGIVLQFCGYAIEDSVRGNWRYIFLIAVLIEFAIVIPLFVLTGEVENRKAGLVEALVFYAIYYSLFAINSLWDACKVSYPDTGFWAGLKLFCLPSQDESVPSPQSAPDLGFMETDSFYVILSFTSKQALFWITIGTVMLEISSEGWLAAIYIGMIIPALILIGFWAYARYRPQWWAALQPRAAPLQSRVDVVHSKKDNDKVAVLEKRGLHF